MVVLRELRSQLIKTERLPGFACCRTGCDQPVCSVIPALGENFLGRFSEWIRALANRRYIPPHTDWESDLQEAAAKFMDFALAFPRRA